MKLWVKFKKTNRNLQRNQPILNHLKIKVLMILSIIYNKSIRKDHRTKIHWKFLRKLSIRLKRSKTCLKKLLHLKRSWHPSSSSWKMMQISLNKLWATRQNARPKIINYVIQLRINSNVFHWLLTKMVPFQELLCISSDETRLRCKIANAFQTQWWPRNLFQKYLRRKE